MYGRLTGSDRAPLVPDLIILDYMWTHEDGSWTLLQLLNLDRLLAVLTEALAAREVETAADRWECPVMAVRG